MVCVLIIPLSVNFEQKFIRILLMLLLNFLLGKISHKWKDNLVANIHFMKTIYDNVELCGIGLMHKEKKKISNETKMNYYSFFMYFFFWRNSIGNNFSIIRLKVSNITWKNLIFYEPFTAHSLSSLSVNLHTNVHVIFKEFPTTFWGMQYHML